MVDGSFDERGLVSVIIPCFNSGRHLSSAIESAFSQTYTQMEIIVVDDGSTDDTAEIAKSYGDRVRYVYQSNRGVSAARNVGVSMASGEFVQFLDADDVLLPEKITRQVDYLLSHPEADVVYCDAMYFDEDDEKNPRPEGWRTHRARADFVEASAVFAPIAVHSVLTRRSVLSRLSGFPENLGHRGEDWYFWMKAALEGIRFHFIPGVGALYRRHSGQVTASNRAIADWECRVMYEFAELFRTYGVTDERRLHALALGFTRQACSWRMSGEREKARELLAKAEEIRPAMEPGSDLPDFEGPWATWSLSLWYFYFSGCLFMGGLTDEAERLLDMSRRMKDIDSNLPLLDKYLENDAKAGYPLYPLAHALAEIGQWERFEAFEKRIMEFEPYSIRLHSGLGKMCLKNGKPVKAAGLVCKALWRWLRILGEPKQKGSS